MTPYVVQEGLFSLEELDAWTRVHRFIEELYEPKDKRFRCHELARAMGRVLELPCEAGYFGNVEHTWLWTRPLLQGASGKPSNILDVYVPGALPQVQLLNYSAAYPLPCQNMYRWNVPGRRLVGFPCIDEEVVHALVELFRKGKY